MVSKLVTRGANMPSPVSNTPPQQYPLDPTMQASRHEPAIDPAASNNQIGSQTPGSQRPIHANQTPTLLRLPNELLRMIGAHFEHESNDLMNFQLAYRRLASVMKPKARASYHGRSLRQIAPPSPKLAAQQKKTALAENLKIYDRMLAEATKPPISREDLAHVITSACHAIPALPGHVKFKRFQDLVALVEGPQNEEDKELSIPALLDVNRELCIPALLNVIKALPLKKKLAGYSAITDIVESLTDAAIDAGCVAPLLDTAYSVPGAIMNTCLARAFDIVEVKHLRLENDAGRIQVMNSLKPPSNSRRDILDIIPPATKERIARLAAAIADRLEDDEHKETAACFLFPLTYSGFVPREFQSDMEKNIVAILSSMQSNDTKTSTVRKLQEYAKGLPQHEQEAYSSSLRPLLLTMSGISDADASIVRE